MNVPPEAREFHRSLSRRALELFEAVEAQPERGRPCPLKKEELPEIAAQLYLEVYRLPLLVGGPRLAELRQAAATVPELLKTIPERIFGNQPSRIAQFFSQADVGFIARALQEPTGAERLIARGDFVLTESGIKCVELNASSRLGGWHLGLFAEPLLADRPWLQEILELQPPAHFSHPLREAMAHLAEQARAAFPHTAKTGVRIAFVLPSAASAAANGMFRDYAQSLLDEVLAGFEPPLAGEVLMTSYDQLRLDRGALYAGERRLHILLEHHGQYVNPMAFQVSKSGGLHLYNGPLALFTGDKRALALLSESQGSDCYDAAERQAIRSYIPWTRIAKDGWTELDGERVWLRDVALAKQERFVLKDSQAAAGRNVLVGRYVEPAVWREAVEKSFETGFWVLQEWLRSAPVWLWSGEEGEMLPYESVWGLFQLGQRFGGGFLRIQRGSRTGIINSVHGSTAALFLEVEEDEEDEP